MQSLCPQPSACAAARVIFSLLFLLLKCWSFHQDPVEPLPAKSWAWVEGLPSTATGVLTSVGGGNRRLQDITSLLPDGLTFTLGDLPTVTLDADLEVVAGVNYSAGISIAADGQSFAQSLDGVAKLRLVRQGTDAQFGGCAEALNYWPGGIGFADHALGLVVDAGIARSQGPVSFMLGGHYRFCYSFDGTFGGSGSSEIMAVPRSIQVRGAQIDCKADGCLEEYRWLCFVYPDEPAPQGSCAARFDTIQYIENFTATRISWGPTVTIDVTSGVVGWTCGATPSAKLLTGYQSPVIGTLGREFELPALPSSSGFSVQVCYCPAYNGCASDSDFVQPAGRAYFFSVRICSDSLCSNEYAVAFPGSPFTLHVDCAGARACSETTGSRVKVIDSSPLGVNDRPSWLETTGCRTATQSTKYWRPQNCVAGQPAQCGGLGGTMNGGGSSEAKVFEGVVMGPAYLAGVPLSQHYDICFCDGQCEADEHEGAEARFHKVGQVEIRPPTLLRIRDSGSDTGLRIVGVAGDIMVDGRLNVPLAPRPAQIKILWDNQRLKTSVDCAGRRGIVDFSSNGQGPACSNDDHCTYKASTTETDPPDNFLGTGSVVNFNDGGAQGERIRFARAGVVAICYCGVMADGSGLQPAGECLREDGVPHWMLMVRTMIRGPCVFDLATELCMEDEWTFYTGISFRLTIRGIGLKSTDKLRIIPQQDRCRDNPDGGGEPTVLKDCPGDCTPLDLADTYAYGGGPGKDDIDLQITTSEAVACDLQNRDCSRAPVVEVLPAADHTIWRFEVDPRLADGDLVVLDNVTGGSTEENALLAGHFGLEPLGWPVARLESPLTWRVPAHLGPSPGRFAANGGGWRRHSLASTREELRATAARDMLQVCWGSGQDAYHARAGFVTFMEPRAMGSATSALSGLEGGRRAPLVVAFTTSAGGEAALRYKLAVHSMQLRLSFTDVAKVEPLLADIDGQPLPEAAPEDRNEIGKAKQFVCGALFLELWSDDEKGFPLPKGCYYYSLMQNSRDLHVLFEPKSGLEAGKQYQLVLNARVAADASTLHRVLSIYSMDDVELLPYGVVEVGDARLNRNPELASGIGEPRFASSGGLRLLDESGELRSLIELTTDPASLLFQLQGEGRSRITPGAQLRLFLWPLTVWDLRPTCQAQCFPHHTKTCGAISSCVCEAVVGGGQRNVVRLQLPMDMTEIYGAMVQHTVRVSELSLPRLGFFGTRFGAQVSLPDDSRVHYIESFGVHVWKAPGAQDPQVTTASIVTREGDGDDKPFRGDSSNTLYVRFALGAALSAELRTGDASLRLTLPTGYECLAVDPVPSTLLLFSSIQPQSRGSLQPSAGGDGGGTWHLTDNTCEYRLAAGELIPARSLVFLRLTVNQPDYPLQKIDVMNQWSLQLASMGWYRRVMQEVDPAPFVGATLESDDYSDFSANVPLLGKLVYDNLQPSSFRAGETENVLQVFLRPEQRTGYQGMVLIKAPLGFSFATLLPDKCQVAQLPESYYRTTTGERPTQYLPVVESCVSDCSILCCCPGSTLNRARIRIRNSLRPEYAYGFGVRLVNKPDYAPSDEHSWVITTTDSGGFRLDASYPTARLNPAIGGTSRGWGVYQDQGHSHTVGLQFSSLSPTAITGALSSVTIFPIELPASFASTCRLLAPDGYELVPVDFLYHASSVPEATASWPGLIPWQSVQMNPGRSNVHGDQAKNVLLWDMATYLHTERYGFTTKLRIPDYSPSRTSSMFILQFGWDAATLEERPIAFTLPLPLVRSITNFAVGYRLNIAGGLNLVTLSLETSTAIPVGGMLRFEVPAGFVFEERCGLEPAPGEAPLPDGLTCIAAQTLAQDSSSLGTAISISPSAAVLPSGRIGFALRARNPSELRTNRAGQETACSYEQCWFVQALDAAGRLTEMRSTAPGFAVNRRMREAKLVDLNYVQRVATARNDRPGASNNLIFAFKLDERPSSVGGLILSGPHGFSFDEDCLPGLRLEDGQYSHRNVFGYLGWLPEFARWEAAARVQSCVSTGPVVRMSIELGLRAARLYAFRIHVNANPVEAPVPNLWTIEYAGETCTPFEGFSLWTFTEYSLLPTTTAASTDVATIPNPVKFRFRPHKEVAADPLGDGTGGLLRVTAPAGFLVVTKGALDSICAEYELVEGLTPFVPGQELQCQPGEQDRANVLSFQFTGSRKLEAGKSYELMAQFYNPRTTSSLPAAWVLSTFSNPSGAPEAALDAAAFPGYAINAQLLRWAVSPPLGEKHAGSLVEDLVLEMAFRSPLEAGHDVLIRAPSGFSLAAPRECAQQLGRVIGGTQERVGFSASMQECAALVWESAPAAMAASWNTLDHRCRAHFGVRSLEVCAPGAVAPTDPEQACSAYTDEVCSFAAQERECHGYALRGQPWVATAPTCNANTLLLRLRGQDLLPSTEVLSFSLTTRNPAQNPRLTESFWIVEQYAPSSELVYSGSVLGWTVIPALAEVSVQLTGLLRASGSLSQLTLQLLPTSDADALQLLALAPAGFDFSAATVEGVARSVTQREASSVTVACPMTGGQRLSPPLVIDGVRLSDPGPATFSLATSRGSAKADEALAVSGSAAFSVPGRIEVLQQELRTTHALQAGEYPYRASFKPRSSDLVVATFEFTVGMSASAGHVLLVSGSPFSFPGEEEGSGADLFKLARSGSGDTLQAVPRAVQNGQVLQVTLVEGLEAGPPYLLQVVVRSGPLVANGELWRFETREVGTQDPDLPVNTNDASIGAFELVHHVGLSIHVGRVPPASTVDLEVIVDPGGSRPQQLLLYAPRDFTFPVGSCLKSEPGQDSKILACRRLAQENTVELQLAGDGLLVATRATVVVSVPDVQDPETNNDWLILAKAQGFETGWGQAEGFLVVQMEHARLVYAGAPAMTAHMAIIFSTSQNLLNGGLVEVIVPEVYKLSCRPSDGFRTLSIPGVRFCSDASNGIRLTLNETMAPGDYALVAGVTNPAFTPMPNRFSIILRDRNGNVVDARMHFEGNRILKGLNVFSSALSFSASAPLALAEIQVVFRVSATIDPYDAMGAVRALQIAVPERFTLITRLPVLNLDGIPTPERGWFKLFYADRLVRIELVGGALEMPDVIPAGDYRFSFHVRLPEFWMPNLNVWLLSLCHDLRCTDLIADIAMAGFYFGDEPALLDDSVETNPQAGGNQRRSAFSPLAAVATFTIAAAAV